MHGKVFPDRSALLVGSWRARLSDLGQDHSPLGLIGMSASLVGYQCEMAAWSQAGFGRADGRRKQESGIRDGMFADIGSSYRVYEQESDT